MKLIVMICLLLQLTSLASCQPTRVRTTTPPSILTTTSTTIRPSGTTKSPSGSVTLTTPLIPGNSSVIEFDNSNSSENLGNKKPVEVLKGQEQGQSPYVGGRGFRGRNGFTPTVGPNLDSTYGPGRYGVPFNAFIPQGLPFSGGAGSRGSSPFLGGRGQSNDASNSGQNGRNNGQFTGPLDLLSGFIPSPGPIGTPTPFGQPVTGYPGYGGYPGSNSNYGSSGPYGSQSPGYNGYGQPNGVGGYAGANGVPDQGQNEAEPDQGSEEAPDDDPGAGGDGEAQLDYDNTDANGDGAESGGETNDGSGGGQGEQDPANDPDLAQFQNLQGGNFPGDLFPPGILSQQDLNDIQKSIEEQQRKEAEKKRQEEEAANAPDYDYDSKDGASAEKPEETPTEPPLPAVKLNRNQYRQPVPSYGTRISGNLSPSHRDHSQARAYPGIDSNNYNNHRPSVDYPTLNRPEIDGYETPRGGLRNPYGPSTGEYDYGRGGGGEHLRGDPHGSRDTGYPPETHYDRPIPTRGSVDYDGGYGDPGERPASYPRGREASRFDEAERYRPGSFRRGSYRGGAAPADLRDFGGHSLNSDQQNEVEPGVDYSPDHNYPKQFGTTPPVEQPRIPGRATGSRKSGYPRFTGPTGPTEPTRPRNRIQGVRPSVDYDSDTRLPGFNRPNRLQTTPGYLHTQLDSPVSSNDEGLPKTANPFGSVFGTGSAYNSPRLRGLPRYPVHNQPPNELGHQSLIDYEDSSGESNEEGNDERGIDEDDHARNHGNPRGAYGSNKGNNRFDLPPRTYYADERDARSHQGNGRDSSSAYRQTPRFVASNKKEAKSLANSQRSNDPFLRG